MNLRKDKAEVWVHTACVDCGENLLHPQSNTKWVTNFQKIFSDVNMEVYEDKVLKHFYVILHTKPTEKAFMSCRQQFLTIPLHHEVEEIMTWASSLEEKK